MRNALLTLLPALALISPGSRAAQPLPLPNAGFEDNVPDAALPAEWRSRGRVDRGGEHALSAEARTGEYCARIRFERRETGYFYGTPAPLPLTSAVHGSAWVNVEAQGPGAYLLLYFRTHDEIYAGGRASSQMISDTQGQWQRLTVSGSPPPHAHEVILALQFEGPGRARFDDAELTFEALPVLPGITLTTPSNQLTPLADGRYAVLSDPVGAQADALLNVSFSCSTGLPPTVHLALVFFDADGQQGYQIQKSVSPTEYDWMSALPCRARPVVEHVRGAAILADHDEATLLRTAIAVAAEAEPDFPAMTSTAVPEHPRLFAAGDALERCRDRLLEAPPNAPLGRLRRTVWDHAEMSLSRDTIQVYGGKYGTTLPPAYPPPHPDRFPYWTGLSREIERGMQTMATRYAVTGEERYGRRAVEWAMALAEWPTWTDPDYQSEKSCLDTSHFCHGVALVYDVCFPLMTPEQKTVLRNALLEKGAAAVMTDATEGWARHWNWPNGFAVVMGGMGIAGMATLGDDPRAEQYVTFARRRLHAFMTSRDRDGGYIEGLLYGGYAMTHITPFAEALRQRGDESLSTHPYMAGTLAFAATCMHAANGTVVNFCDSGRRASPYWTTALLRASYDDPTAQWFLQRTEFGNGIGDWGMTYALSAAAVDNPPVTAEVPLSAVYRDIGWVVHRNGIEADDWLVAVRGGPRGSHCQADQNSRQLCIAGEWLFTDPGYGKSATSMHTTVLVNGKGQSGGDGRVAAFAALPGFRYSRHEADDCYPELSAFSRHLALIGDAMLLVVDEITPSDKTAEVESRLQLSRDGDASTDGRSAIHVQGRNQRAVVSLAPALLESIELVDAEPLPHARIRWKQADHRSTPLVVTAGEQPRQIAVEHLPDKAVLIRVNGSRIEDHILIAPDNRRRRLAPSIDTNARVSWVRLAQDGAICAAAIIRGTHLSQAQHAIIKLDTIGDASVFAADE